MVGRFILGAGLGGLVGTGVLVLTSILLPLPERAAAPAEAETNPALPATPEESSAPTAPEAGAETTEATPGAVAQGAAEAPAAADPAPAGSEPAASEPPLSEPPASKPPASEPAAASELSPGAALPAQPPSEAAAPALSPDQPALAAPPEAETAPGTALPATEPQGDGAALLPGNGLPPAASAALSGESEAQPVSPRPPEAATAAPPVASEAPAGIAPETGPADPLPDARLSESAAPAGPEPLPEVSPPAADAAPERNSDSASGAAAPGAETVAPAVRRIILDSEKREASAAQESAGEAPAAPPAAPGTGSADPAPAEPDLADALSLPEGRTPLDYFARAFDNPGKRPLFSVILIDDGAAETDRDTLAALPFPVTFALDPQLPDATELAKIYRAEGQEVVMLASFLPEGAVAADIETGFAAMDRALPMAVAVMDMPGRSFQNNRMLASIIVPVIGDQGRGLVTWDQGLNAAGQVAKREDLPSAAAFRDLDSAGETTEVIRRYLDRAAFKAAQAGKVTVVGRIRPETIAALLEWSLEGRAATVALAPVSAVLSVD